MSGVMKKRAFAALSASPTLPCRDLSLQHLISSSSRRPRQRPRCVASGWEVHSRIKPSSTCDRAPTFLTRANDVDAIDDVISRVTGQCRVEDAWRSWELSRAAAEAQHLPREPSPPSAATHWQFKQAALASDSGGHDFQLRQQVSTLAAHALRLYDERSSAPQLPGRIPCSMSNVDALLSMNVEAARTTPLYDDRRIADRRISTAHP